MTKALWLLSTGFIAIAAPAAAQEGGAAQPAAAAAAAAENDTINQGEIVVTATRRASPLSDVPIAVSAVTAQSLQNSGATDIRQLNQLTPSLLVSSTSSEAGAGGARIRGIGTVGDNPGLESSVATFIDGVYRNRAGVGLTELGPIDRIEVLRGPQGTLFGRNASAGLINIVTAQPKFDFGGYGEGSYGNYNYYRIAAGVTGPIAKDLAFRLDGVYTKRDGYLKDVISGRDVNGRDRYLIRGKLLYEPSDDLSVMLIGDYSKRNEECCAATYLPARDVIPTGPGTFAYAPSSIENIITHMQSLVPGAGVGQVIDDTYSRKIALTPGRDYRSDVRDYGISGEVNWNLGGAKITSITAYRDWKYIKGQDADFTNLDLLYRPGDGSGYTQFKTFSQELRVQGSLFSDKLDWLIGGYYSHEDLNLNDNLRYGADYDQFAAARVRLLSPAFGPFGPIFANAFSGFNNLKGFSNVLGTLAASPAAGALLASQVSNVALSGTGELDQYRQTDRNLAIFTHNIFHVTDRLSLTLGARYTDDKKRLNANYSSNTGCGGYVQSIGNLKTLAGQAAAGGNLPLAQLAGGYAQVLAALSPLACVINGVNGDYAGRKKEGEWSGTAVLSYKPTDRLLTYASYSRGYKAGGFNLDRSPLFDNRTLTSITNLNQVLTFQPEKVDSYEIGAKLSGRKFNLNIAAFYERYKNFQLNSFNGTVFFVTDIHGCSDSLGTTDQDNIAGNSNCAHTKAGVTSKGVEVEAFMYPSRYFTVNAGFTYADTKYSQDLAGDPDPYIPAYGNSLDPSLFLLPGGRLSNSSQYAITGAATWTPPITDDLKGLAYVDFRYTSEVSTGSDLEPEKFQPGVMLVNARLGLSRADGRWGIELWAQNLFNTDYQQVAFNSPLQGGGTQAATQRFGTPSNQLFSSFLGEPRTYGVTVRTKF